MGTLFKLAPFCSRRPALWIKIKQYPLKTIAAEKLRILRNYWKTMAFAPTYAPTPRNQGEKLNCITLGVLTQKCFTTDFLTKKRKINEGEIPQYYIENSHEAIIRPEEWDAVQDEIARRRAIGGLYRSCNVLSAKIKCGDCGGWYGAKVWHSTDKYRARVWQCNRKFDEGKPRCRTPHLQEEDIKARFLEAYSSMITDKTPYIEVCRTAREMLTDTKAIDAEMKELCGEMEIVAGLTQKCVQQNAVTEQDQEEFNARYNSYVERYEKAKTRYEALKAQQAAKLTEPKANDRFTADLIERDDTSAVHFLPPLCPILVYHYKPALPRGRPAAFLRVI